MKLKTQIVSCFSATKMAICRPFHFFKRCFVERPPLQHRLVPPQDLVQNSKAIFPEQKMISPVGVPFLATGVGQWLPDHTEVKPEWRMAGVGVTHKSCFGDKGAPDNANAIRHREITVLTDHISDRGTVSRLADGFHSQTERHSVWDCKINWLPETQAQTQHEPNCPVSEPDRGFCQHPRDQADGFYE